jgi:hypothetical protein
MLSELYRATAMALSPRTVCGVAAFASGLIAAALVVAVAMPNGVKMRSRTNASQLWPVTAGTISPAARNRLFW